MKNNYSFLWSKIQFLTLPWRDVERRLVQKFCVEWSPGKYAKLMYSEI